MSHSLKVWLAKVKKTDQKLVMGKIKTGQEMVMRTDLARVFAFIEGTLTEAVKNCYWILPDEVNMAPASLLECLSQLLEREDSITLYEAGDYKSIPRHKYFRLFACMNPATDTGKADQVPGLRFTELYCDEMADHADITMLVTDYFSVQAKQISSIVTFYAQVGTNNIHNIGKLNQRQNSQVCKHKLKCLNSFSLPQARLAAETTLTNMLGHRPTFSLRTICR